MERVCEYFQRQGVKSDARRLAGDIWQRCGNRLAPEVDVRYLDDENKEDRNLFEKWNSS